MSNNLKNGTAIACGSLRSTSDEYNKPLHVGALFVVFGISTLAALFPLMATRVNRLRIPQKALFTIKHFGTGVLMSVAILLHWNTPLTPRTEGPHSATSYRPHLSHY